MTEVVQYPTPVKAHEKNTNRDTNKGGKAQEDSV